MTEKERLLSVLTGKKYDRPPFIIPGGMMTMAVTEAMDQVNAFWPEAHLDPKKMALLVKGLHDLAGIENVGVPFCMTVEAEAMGAKVSLGAKGTEPKVTGYAIDSIDDIDKLKPITASGNGRVKVLVEAVKILVQECESAPVIANLVGPISLVTSIIEPLIFLKAVKKNKEKAHRLLKFVTENLIVYAGLLIKAGADIVVIGDPTATGEILGPDVFKEFALPYLNIVTREVERIYKKKSIVHICGDIKSIMGELNNLQATGLSVDALTNLRQVREKVKSKILMGNVSTFVLANNSPERVAEVGINCLKSGADILSPACGISPTTPLENLKALSTVAKQSGARKIKKNNQQKPRKTFGISIEPDLRKFVAESGELIFDLVQKARLPLNAGCGGQGTCGKCRIQVLKGKVSPLTDEEKAFLNQEEISQGIRLACLTKILGPVKIKLLNQGKEAMCRILEEGHFALHTHNPLIKKEYIKDFSDGQSHRSYAETIEEQSGKVFSKEDALAALRSFPLDLKEKKLDATIVVEGKKIIGIEQGNTKNTCFGIAVDVGTTTVVASLIDLGSGNEIATASELNSQRIYGHDVLSRIQKTNETPQGLFKLQGSILRNVDALIGKLSQKQGIDRKYIYEIAFAGNPTMLHLLLGISPAAIGKSPYVPVFRGGLKFKSDLLGLNISRFGQGYCLPAVSGYVGADIVAGVIATGLNRQKEPILFIDIGTNGEIVLSYKGKMAACSCAAGPAWEGMNISCGMIASEGAIEIVEFDNSAISFRTIEDKPPLGVCGSGVIDVTAALLESGLLESSGRFKIDGSSKLSERLLNKNDEQRFILVESSLSGNGRDIFISQKDIRQVQLAKGAIASGIKVLLREIGLNWQSLSKIFIAGAFGKHLRVESLEKIGLIPKGLGNKVSFVGNTSKSGAALCLLSSKKRNEAEEVSKNIRYLELSTYPDYEKIFIKDLSFAPAEDDRPGMGKSLLQNGGTLWKN